MREMIKCSSNPCTYYGSIYYTTILVREFVDWFPPKNIMYNDDKSLPCVGDSRYSNYLPTCTCRLQLPDWFRLESRGRMFDQVFALNEFQFARGRRRRQGIRRFGRFQRPLQHGKHGVDDLFHDCGHIAGLERRVGEQQCRTQITRSRKIQRQYGTVNPPRVGCGCGVGSPYSFGCENGHGLPIKYHAGNKDQTGSHIMERVTSTLGIVQRFDFDVGQLFHFKLRSTQQ